jgi:hypothetical protein
MGEDVIPKKRRWKRWALLVVCALIAAGLIVPPILNSRAEKRIRRRIERYQAAGEPVTIDDLRTPPVPEDENAVIELRRAGAMVSTYANTSGSWATYQRTNRRDPLTPQELSTLGKIVSDNRAAIPLVDAAMKKTRFFWPSQPTSPVISWLLPDLTPQRFLSDLLAMAAIADANAGDDAAAADDLLRGLFVAKALSHHPQALVVSLTVEAMRRNVCVAIIEIGPRMKIGNDPREARPEQMQRIIVQLLDDGWPRDDFRRGYFGERIMMFDTADAILSGRMSASAMFAAAGGGSGSSALGVMFSPAGRYFTSSWMLDDLAMILDTETTVISALDLPDWPAAKARVTHLWDSMAKASIKHVWAQVFMPNLEQSLHVAFRGRVHRHLAAVVLAIRWYASEHDGKFPATLESLAPKYLPAVPGDPLAAGAPALRYINDPNDPRVYSVGENGVDDHGAEKPTAAGEKDPFWAGADVVVHFKARADSGKK